MKSTPHRANLGAAFAKWAFTVQICCGSLRIVAVARQYQPIVVWSICSVDRCGRLLRLKVILGKKKAKISKEVKGRWMLTSFKIVLLEFPAGQRNHGGDYGN
jgi:hypothetical protein